MPDTGQALAQQLDERHQTQALAAGGMLSADVLRDRVNQIQRAMKGVMKANTHYGTIPGTPKPTLYKPGAEVICTLFQLGVDPTEVVDLGDADCIRYRVRVKLFSQLDGRLVGVGIGECSSDEEKYRWKRATNEAEWNDTDEARRRRKHASGRNGNYTILQVRTNPADVANTILKMAKKRAFIDAVLTATAASDMFTQDIEDLPEDLRTAGLDAHDRDDGPAPEPEQGNAAVKNRVDRSREGGGPDPHDDGDGETRTEAEVGELLQELIDDAGGESPSQSKADAVQQLNYVVGLIRTVPDEKARARLRALQTQAHKAIQAMGEEAAS